MATFSLTEIESKAYSSTLQDGIWDILPGLSLLIVAISALLSNIGAPQAVHMGVFVGLQASAVVAFIAGKKRITAPRMGFVRFGLRRMRRIRKTHIVLLGSVLAGAAALLIVTPLTQDSPAGRATLLLFGPVAWSANSIIVFSLLAYYLDCARHRSGASGKVSASVPWGQSGGVR